MAMSDTAMSEPRTSEQAETVKLAGYRRQIARLPLTMRPSLNRQLGQWETLFPYERGRLAVLLRGVELFQPASLDELTAPLRAVEAKMGVEKWNFTETTDTIENSSMLARSAYYAEWRHEVQRIFEAVNAAARDTATAPANLSRLLLLILPESLPADPLTVWKPWGSRGREIAIKGDARRIGEFALQGQTGAPGVAALLARHGGPQGSMDSSDFWLIDAEAKLVSLIAPASPPVASHLSCAALKPFRDKLLADLNTIPKSIAGADQTIAGIRREDWDRLWPAELAGQSRLRNFVIDLCLSGNGALIFTNSFVEWAASEALRRARPRAMVARFGMRSKPKPFASIAIFENQQHISALPDVDDPEGSAIDAAILARYIWLAATRYPEYEQAFCLCVSESQNSGLLICPEGQNAPWSLERPVTPEEMCLKLTQVIAI
jgi:hypothetical protein